MWRTFRQAAVTAAVIVATWSIACAQANTAASAASGATGASAQISTSTAAAGAGQANTGAQGPSKDGAQQGSLMPCHSGPPYTSLPCLPVHRRAAAKPTHK